MTETFPIDCEAHVGNTPVVLNTSARNGHLGAVSVMLSFSTADFI